MKLSHFFVGLSLLLLMGSCAIYNPHAVDVPLLHERGDLRIDGTVAMSIPALNPSVNATASYGFTDCLAGQFHMDYSFDGYYFQAAPGLFHSFSKFVLEGYAGIGLGGKNYTTESVNYQRLYNSFYQIYYGQFNLGWVNLANGHIDVGLGLKAGLLNSDISCTFTGLTPDHEREPEYYKGKDFLLEPQLVFRVGGPKFKVGFNIGLAYIDQFKDDFFFYEPWNIGVSINWNL